MARLQRCGAAVEWPGRRADPVVQMGMEDGDMIDANLQQVRGLVLVRAPSFVYRLLLGRWGRWAVVYLLL